MPCACATKGTARITAIAKNILRIQGCRLRYFLWKPAVEPAEKPPGNIRIQNNLSKARKKAGWRQNHISRKLVNVNDMRQPRKKRERGLGRRQYKQRAHDV